MSSITHRHQGTSPTPHPAARTSAPVAAQGASAGISRRALVGAAGAAVAAAMLFPGADPHLAHAAVPVPQTWDYECDVAVVGSGTVLAGAGKAAAEGNRVIIIEAAGFVGGTTSISNGQTWMPLNSVAMEQGKDNYDDALAYITATAAGKSTPEILEAFLAYGPEAIDFLAETGDFTWEISPRVDYHIDVFPGATDMVRTIAPVGKQSTEAGQMTGAFGTTSSGSYVTDPLCNGIVEKYGGELLLNTRAMHLITRVNDEGATEVCGVQAQGEDGATINIKASKAVILGAGGFGWNDDMKRRYLELPANRTMEVSTCVGDGILMGQAVGADVSLMQYAWGQVVCVDPEDMPYYAWCEAPTEINHFGLGTFYGLMCKPGSCVLNKFGRRFMNEAVDYDSLYHGFWGRDLGANQTTDDAAHGTSWTNCPAFYICDSTVADAENSVMRDADGAIVSWVAYQADTLDGLLDQIPWRDEYARQKAAATIEEYNANCSQGIDPEFHRGETRWDQGGTSRPEVSLAPIEQGPFYCVICEPYPMCTKGGLRVNEKAQVLSVTGEVIPRLYAAGNNSGIGGPGLFYNGAGGTLGPGFTFSYIAGIGASQLEAWE